MIGLFCGQCDGGSASGSTQGRQIQRTEDRRRQTKQADCRWTRSARSEGLSKALSLFEQAFRLKPTPELLFHLGKVAESQGQAIVAADLYHRYLEAGGWHRRRITGVAQTSQRDSFDGR